MRLTKEEKAIAAGVLNAMLRETGVRGSGITRYMLHPCHGQFDATPDEAARSFVYAFAVKHGLHKVGVKVPDPSWFKGL
jgi:hypothetical protein